MLVQAVGLCASAGDKLVSLNFTTRSLRTPLRDGLAYNPNSPCWHSDLAPWRSGLVLTCSLSQILTCGQI